MNAILQWGYAFIQQVQQQQLSIYQYNQIQMVHFQWEWLFQPFLFFHAIPFLLYMILCVLIGVKALKTTRQAYYKYNMKPEDLVKKGDSRWTTIP
ncbi:hypothetical protein, partial [Listeria fleischmannii]|uniref:hypothetical protein n=1 Tax=Listeria fleischmannii TaxID=1069827 RepID=UPI001C88E34E